MWPHDEAQLVRPHPRQHAFIKKGKAGCIKKRCMVVCVDFFFSSVTMIMHCEVMSIAVIYSMEIHHNYILQTSSSNIYWAAVRPENESCPNNPVVRTRFPPLRQHWLFSYTRKFSDTSGILMKSNVFAHQVNQACVDGQITSGANDLVFPWREPENSSDLMFQQERRRSAWKCSQEASRHTWRSACWLSGLSKWSDVKANIPTLVIILGDFNYTTINGFPVIQLIKGLKILIREIQCPALCIPGFHQRANISKCTQCEEEILLSPISDVYLY